MFNFEHNRSSYSLVSSVVNVSESTSSDDDEIDNVGGDGGAIDADPAMVDKDYLAKKYTAMQRKYHTLQADHDRLVLAHQALKANSLRECTPVV